MKNVNGMTLEAIIKAAAKVYRVSPAEMMETGAKGTPVLARCIAVHVARSCYNMRPEQVAWKFGVSTLQVAAIAGRAHKLLLDSPQTVRDADAIEREAIAIMAKRQHARQDIIKWRAETAQIVPRV